MSTLEYPEISHGHWVYAVEAYHDPSEAYFYACNVFTEQRIMLHFRGREYMTQEAFSAFVETGFPNNPSGAPWTCEEIINHARNIARREHHDQTLHIQSGDVRR